MVPHTKTPRYCCIELEPCNVATIVKLVRSLVLDVCVIDDDGTKQYAEKPKYVPLCTVSTGENGTAAGCAANDSRIKSNGTSPATTPAESSFVPIHVISPVTVIALPICMVKGLYSDLGKSTEEIETETAGGALMVTNDVSNACPPGNRLCLADRMSK